MKKRLIVAAIAIVAIITVIKGTVTTQIDPPDTGLNVPTQTVKLG